MFDFGVLIRGLNTVYTTCSKRWSHGQAALSFKADWCADPHRL